MGDNRTHASRRNRTNAVSGSGRAFLVGEHQPPGGISTPRLHPSLERSEVGLGELTRILRLKAFRYVGEFRNGAFAELTEPLLRGPGEKLA